MRADVAVIGGGITGLAAAAWLAADHGVDDVVVVEASPRPGGKMRTLDLDGHVLEEGPQGFLDSGAGVNTLELARRSGLGPRLVQADGASAARFVVRGGVLQRLPTSPLAFLRSGLLPLTGRLRVLAEPFAARRPDGDETVYEFARRRIGRHAADVLVDAMVTGVFAGDARQLSLAATFPRMAAMEAEHGSLTRALIARSRQARREGRRSSGPAGPGGTLTTFARGMAELPTTLATGLGDRFLASWPVERLAPDGGAFRLAGPRGEISARTVLVALPPTPAADLVAPVAADAEAPLRGIGTVPIAVVMTSYADRDAFGGRTDGFGFLVPRAERLGILGTLFCHAIFPGHVPTGRLLLRTMLGGARDPEILDLDDAEMLERVRNAHRRVLAADPDPDRTWIVRWERGISQYTTGHLGRVEAVEAAARAVGLEVAGSAYRGVSVNDCVTQARAAAGRLAARLRDQHPGRASARR